METDGAGKNGEHNGKDSSSPIDDTSLQVDRMIYEGAPADPVIDISKPLLPTPQVPKPRTDANPHIRPEHMSD